MIRISSNHDRLCWCFVLRIKKFILPIIALELSACGSVRNSDLIAVEVNDGDSQRQNQSDSTPILEYTPIKGNENSQEVKNQSDFQMGEVTPLPVKITDEPNKICSPLTSVPLEELPTVVSDPYRPPLPGKDDRHQGVDFAFYRRYGLASIAGEIVQAVFEGKVAGIVENKYPYGNALIIETPFDKISQTSRQTLGLQKDQSIYTLYGHLDHISIKEIAQEIEACQAIGVVGKTGNAGVEHLHLEMRIGPAGEILPSMSYYVKEATPAEREAYLRWRISNEFVHFNPMLLLDTTP